MKKPNYIVQGLRVLGILALFGGAFALAQGTGSIARYATAVGLGPGFTGFQGVAPGAAGLAYTSNGASAFPSFQAITPSTFGTQSANRVLAGPTSGGAASPTFRALVTADLPAINFSSLTGSLGSSQIATTTITGLTAKASPVATDDYVIIYDAAGNAVKKARVADIAAAGSFGWATRTLSSNTTLDATDRNKLIWVDATSAPVNISLPAASTFGVGLFGIKKIDITSNLVKVVGTLEESQTEILLPLEGKAQIYASNGTLWKLIAPGLGETRGQSPIAEHTTTGPTYTILPDYNNYIILADATAAPIQINLPPISTVTLGAGTHQTFNICVNKFDASANVVTLIRSGADVINWTSTIQVDIAAQFGIACVWADGARWIVTKKF